MTDTCDSLPSLANDSWMHLLTPAERIQLTPAPHAHWVRDRLVLDPEERPSIHKLGPHRWVVHYHRPVACHGVADEHTEESWAQALLAAIEDVRLRLCDWVATNDGLTD
jgi:hypothetical protein